MTKLVIFDLDGTIADTSEGILNSHKYAHSVMRRPIPSDETLLGVIGEPLLDTYRYVFQFGDDNAREAVSAYRTWYAGIGIHQASLYPKIETVLYVTRSARVLVFMATLKSEAFAKTMLTELGIISYFDMVFGMDGADSLTKSDLIQKCLSCVNAKPEQALMVGDSLHDYNGAKKCDVPFLGVSYGFGFRPGDAPPCKLCNSTDELSEALLSILSQSA